MIPFTKTEKNLEHAKSLAKEIKFYCFSIFEANDSDKFEISYFNDMIEIVWFGGYDFDERDFNLIEQSLDYIVRTYGKLYLERNEYYVFEVELPHFHMVVKKCTEVEDTFW